MKSLPQNWCEVSVRDIASIVSGIGFPNRYQGKTSGDLGFYKVGDISRAVLYRAGRLTNPLHYVSLDVAAELKGTPIPPGATVFAKIGEAIRLNRRAYVVHECLVDNNVMAVKGLFGEFDRYLYLFLRSQDFTELARATTVPSLRKGDIEGLGIPLPPLNEQQRIADKLDAVLARVDACRERLDRVPDILKRFRQAILAAATSGELTKDWRVDQLAQMAQHAEFGDAIREGAGPRHVVGANLDSAAIRSGHGTAGRLNDEMYAPRRVLFSDLVQDSVVGLVRSASEQFSAAGDLTPYLKMNNIHELWGVNLTNVVQVRCSAEETARFALEPGDWLFNTRNSIELVGKSCVWKGGRFVFNNNILRVRFNHSVVPDFVEIWFRSPAGRTSLNLVKSATTSVAAVYQRSLMTQILEIPSLEEQNEIVRRVESLFAYADRLEARYAAARAQVERLTPALLAKAFRGELVPQDPNDEPASVLLERIRAARTAAPAKPKRGRAAASRAAGRQTATPAQGDQAQRVDIARPGAGRTERGEDDDPDSTYLRSAFR